MHWKVEHLESSDAKDFMNEPVVRNLCVGKMESYMLGRKKVCRKKEVMCGEEGKLCVGKRENV